MDKVDELIAMLGAKNKAQGLVITEREAKLEALECDGYNCCPLAAQNKALEAKLEALEAKLKEQETRWNWLERSFLEIGREYSDFAYGVIPVIHKCRYEALEGGE